MKLRVMIVAALALGVVTLWGRSSAADVKFRIAPVETREPSFEFLTDPQADIPTPQFFRIVIDKQQGSLVLEDAFAQKIMLTPLPRLNPTSPSQAPPERSRQPNLSHTSTPYLTGVETLLLRDADTLVEQSNR